MSTQTQTKKIIRDLGDGLILRHAVPSDGEALALFNGEQHGDGGLASPDGQRLAAMTRDLFTRPHASLTPDDFTIVEETASGRIVSAMCLIRQTWTYEGIDFGMGRPEYVATHPDFRKRGLIRAQFDVVHQWCAERDLIVQGITGIPYFYRQFGYEFALNLGGRRFGSQVPKLKDGATEKFCMRAAEEKDIPFMMSVYEHGRKRSMISANWPEVHWHNNLYEISPDNIQRLEFRVIEEIDTLQPVGYLAHPAHLITSCIYAFHFELMPDFSWLEAAPFVARYLWKTGQEYATTEVQPCETFGFYLGAQHPAYEALGELTPTVRPPYGWYIRVPDLVGFLHHIKPVLEKRLAESVACGHSGEYLIGMYPKGIKLILERGRIASIEPWKPDHADHGNAGFPALTFLQILFGYRSYEELMHAFPDCWWDNDGTRVVINALFPKKNSNVYGIV
jgi:GNAT superfamily N-acetyltransferase